MIACQYSFEINFYNEIRNAFKNIFHKVRTDLHSLKSLYLILTDRAGFVRQDVQKSFTKLTVNFMQKSEINH